MKKLCSVFLVLVLILSLTACGGTTNGEENNSDNTPSTENSSSGSENTNTPEESLPPADSENSDIPVEPVPPADSESSDIPVESFPPADSENSDIPVEPTSPADPQPETYTVIISEEWADGPVDSWQITGVFAEGVGYASSGLPLRILYTVSGSSATILRSFYPDDYPYIGAYVDNGDGTFNCDYSQLEPYGQWETFDEDGMSVCATGSGYPSLPDGSWYFGAVRESNSFYIVVGNPDAAASGTIPSM